MLSAPWRSRVRGAYLALHFATLLPWAKELFSAEGMLPEAAASPLLRAFPNVFALADGPLFATAFVGLGALCAGLLVAAAEKPTLRAAAALGALYVLACCFGRNPLIRNPSLPYVGLALLALAAARGRALPRDVVTVLWVLRGVGYGYSGLTKLAAPSWVDGSAMGHLLTNPLARPHAAALLALPESLRKLATWGVLGLEIAFPLLLLTRRGRRAAWFAMTAMHLGLLVLIDFADLTLGMLVTHLFVAGDDWLGAPRTRHGRPEDPNAPNAPSGSVSARPSGRPPQSKTRGLKVSQVAPTSSSTTNVSRASRRRHGVGSTRG